MNGAKDRGFPEQRIGFPKLERSRGWGCSKFEWALDLQAPESTQWVDGVDSDGGEGRTRKVGVGHRFRSNNGVRWLILWMATEFDRLEKEDREF